MFKRLCISLLCLFVLVGCSSTELRKQTFTIELGQDVFANPELYVKNANDNMEVKAVSNGIRKKDNRFVTGNMDYLVVGVYDFKIVEGHKETPFRIKIKDTQAPVVTNVKSEITVSADSTIDWASEFEATDLSGVDYTCDPDVDTSTAGEYEVSLTIADRFGNSTSRTVKVTVE